MARVVLWLGLFLFDGAGSAAAILFADANTRYQKADFAAAEESYRRLLDSGYRSGAVFFNLGNACFKQKKLGEAIYFWEQARRRMPADRETADNLDLANLLVVDRIEVPPNPLPLRWLDAAVHSNAPEEEGWIVLALWTVANALLGLRWLIRRPRLRVAALASGLAAAGLFGLVTASLSWKLYEQHYHLDGVVVARKVDIRSGPGRENITVFTVHEGTRVRLRGETPGWYQVSLANGWTGWVEQSFVRVL